MTRFRLIFLGAGIAGFLSVVFIFSSTPAQAKQCSTERPPDARSYWSYRLIDGRKCWYEGKPMLSKSSLHWPTSGSSQAAIRPALDVVPANHYNLLDAQASITDDSPIAATPKVSTEVAGAGPVPTPAQTLTPDHLRAWASGMAAMTTEESITKLLDRRADEGLPQQREHVGAGRRNISNKHPSYFSGDHHVHGAVGVADPRDFELQAPSRIESARGTRPVSIRLCSAPHSSTICPPS